MESELISTVGDFDLSEAQAAEQQFSVRRVGGAMLTRRRGVVGFRRRGCDEGDQSWSKWKADMKVSWSLFVTRGVVH